MNKELSRLKDEQNRFNKYITNTEGIKIERPDSNDFCPEWINKYLNDFNTYHYIDGYLDVFYFNKKEFDKLKRYWSNKQFLNKVVV